VRHRVWTVHKIAKENLSVGAIARFYVQSATIKALLTIEGAWLMSMKAVPNTG